MYGKPSFFEGPTKEFVFQFLECQFSFGGYHRANMESSNLFRNELEFNFSKIKVWASVIWFLAVTSLNQATLQESSVVSLPLDTCLNTNHPC